jgi:hypothetical protein
MARRAAHSRIVRAEEATPVLENKIPFSFRAKTLKR